ncbi:MAG: hypothetical protein ACJ8LI_02955 [Chthoniobacterales bacterium]
MRSTSLRPVAAFCALLLALACSAPAKDPAGGKSNVKEGAYYEFRGHMSDRDTIANTFTLGWDKGSQPIVVNHDTRVFRYGRAAKLGDAKAGDAARGFGRVLNGKLIAVAVAFGDDGVELPPQVTIPPSITLPPARASD